MSKGRPRPVPTSNGVAADPGDRRSAAGPDLRLPARIFEEAGLPPRLLPVVVGGGSDIGDAIVEHHVPRVVTFTVPTPVGRGIAPKAGLKHQALELGGNGPIVVLDDADIELAVNAAVFGSYFHQGQICMIGNRLIVDDAGHDEFVDRFVDRVRALRVSDPPTRTSRSARSSTSRSSSRSRTRSPGPAMTAHR